MKIKGRWRLILVAGLAASSAGVVGGCGPAPPVIADFSCSPAEISGGESATLSWAVRGATKVSIDKGVGMVDAVGTKEVSPSKTTTYTLLAINSGVVVSSSVVVRVGTASPPSADTTAPVITNLSASSVTAASAVVTWSTDELATSQIEYGTTASYGSTTTLDEELVTNHSVSLTGLEGDTTYRFRVKSEDVAENEAVSTDETFTTSAEADTTPPVISGVDASGVTDSGVTVTWSTDEPATSQVEYGQSGAYGSVSTLDPAAVTSHSVTLSDLSPGVEYHYRVKSKDEAGNEAVATDEAFTTSAEADTTPAVISGAAVSNVTDAGATVTWTTDEPATSQVEYGTTASYGSTTSLDTNLVTSHTVTLSGLTADTRHHFRVKSRDNAENEVASDDYTFTTSKSATEVGGIISTNTVWTEANSPYIITETAQIASGVTLTIEPGANIGKPTSGNMFLLMGTIYAHGTSQKPIVIDGGGNSKIIYTQPGYGYGDFQYCVIKNGRDFWDRWGHLDLRYSELVNLSVGSRTDWAGRIIGLDGPLGESNIEYNRFINTGGITSYDDSYGTNIRYNLFQGLRSPLAHMGGGTPSNPPRKMIVKFNSFIGIEGLALYLATGFIGWSPSIGATENYWGTLDTNIIDEMIYDRNDDISVENYIDFLPILSEPDPNTPSPD